jgi:hypothetical protein
MLSFELKDVLRVSLGLTFVFFLCGTGFLVAALDFPVMETGSRILEKSIPISWTAGVNGQVSVPFQAVEGGDYEVDAHPSPNGNWFEVVRTYISISSSGPPINESYALYINFDKRDAVVYGLKPGNYYVVVDYNLTSGNLEYGLYVCVYHSYRIPDPYHNVAYAFFAASLISVIISGASWFVLKRRTPDFTLGLRIGFVISFFSALLALVSTALPWYSYMFYESPTYPSLIMECTLQNLIDFGLPSVGRAWFIQLAWVFIVIGCALALVSSVIGLFEKKATVLAARRLLAAASLLTLLSPTILLLGFLNYGIPLYGIASVYPHRYIDRYVGFLSYGFFSDIIAGILMLTAVILTTSENKSKKLED